MSVSPILPEVTLGIALGEFDHGIREDTPNDSERIRQYLRGTMPPIHTAAPWCAAFVQYVSDTAAKALASNNPLDEVRLEALVQSYYDWAADELLLTSRPREGDLVCFQFGGTNVRWNHMGIVVRPPGPNGGFWTVEGNTSREAGGEGVEMKHRSLRKSYPVAFIRWVQ